uniref:Uncharacterized protein n=1 Tax=Anguilla anguilla TaxID=7936 RepID=A0A0E9U7L1_ANGAN
MLYCYTTPVFSNLRIWSCIPTCMKTRYFGS